MAKVIRFMSHQSVAWALDAPDIDVRTPTEVAVLVALVEFSDSHGRNAFPAHAPKTRRHHAPFGPVAIEQAS
jgi:hypothetical protein